MYCWIVFLQGFGSTLLILDNSFSTPSLKIFELPLAYFPNVPYRWLKYSTSALSDYWKNSDSCLNMTYRLTDSLIFSFDPKIGWLGIYFPTGAPWTLIANFSTSCFEISNYYFQIKATRFGPRVKYLFCNFLLLVKQFWIFKFDSLNFSSS